MDVRKFSWKENFDAWDEWRVKFYVMLLKSEKFQQRLSKLNITMAYLIIEKSK